MNSREIELFLLVGLITSLVIIAMTYLLQFIYNNKDFSLNDIKSLRKEKKDVKKFIMDEEKLKKEKQKKIEALKKEADFYIPFGLDDDDLL